jgi:hypothetical protein
LSIFAFSSSTVTAILRVRPVMIENQRPFA